MAPDRPKFDVMEFIRHEIIACSSDPSSACHYAPYIFHMIKAATQLNIVPNIIHMAYRSNKGKIEQTLHIAGHSTVIRASGSFLGAYASNFTPGASSSRAAPPSPTGPSTSRRRKASKSKQGKLSFIAQGIFACFNMCRQNAHEMREHRRYMDEELLKIERRQKELMAKVDIPHSPVPPPIYNPWDDYVPQEYPFAEDVELDYGGQEMPFQGGQANSDEEEEEEEEGGDDET
jgi:hypothetical protein